MYCIKCEKNKVTPTNLGKVPKNLEEELQLLYRVENSHNGKTTVENGMTNDGDISIISMGYGSTLDGDMYLIAICDDCIRSLNEMGIVLTFGNYMFGDFSEDVEKSKKHYIRRRNLDNLV